VQAGERALKERRQGSAAAEGKGTRLFRKEEEEDRMAADLVLVVPEAGVDRVEWAKQVVGNAVRSPHARCRAVLKGRTNNRKPPFRALF
jgi:hypothetical protein